MSRVLTNIFWWVGLLLLQFALLFYFRATLVYTPYIYVFLLLRFPKSFTTIGLLFLAFFTGFGIDIFTNSWGIHAFSAVFIVFIFKSITAIFAQQSLDEEVELSTRSMGTFRYALALFSLFFIYHLLVIFLWNFSFDLIFYNISKTFLSTLIASFIIFLLLSLFNKTRKEEENG